MASTQNTSEENRCPLCFRTNSITNITLWNIKLRAAMDEVFSFPIYEDSKCGIFVCALCIVIIHKFDMYQKKIYLNQLALQRSYEAQRQAEEAARRVNPNQTNGNVQTNQTTEGGFSPEEDFETRCILADRCASDEAIIDNFHLIEEYFEEKHTLEYVSVRNWNKVSEASERMDAPIVEENVAPEDDISKELPIVQWRDLSEAENWNTANRSALVESGETAVDQWLMQFQSNATINHDTNARNESSTLAVIEESPEDEESEPEDEDFHSCKSTSEVGEGMLVQYDSNIMTDDEDEVSSFFDNTIASRRTSILSEEWSFSAYNESFGQVAVQSRGPSPVPVSQNRELVAGTSVLSTAYGSDVVRYRVERKRTGVQHTISKANHPKSLRCICGICSSEYASKYDPWHICKWCKLFLPDETSRLLHLCPIEPLKCSVCSCRVLRHKFNFHMNTVHEKPKEPLRWNLRKNCGQKFTYRSGRRQHDAEMMPLLPPPKKIKVCNKTGKEKMIKKQKKAAIKEVRWYNPVEITEHQNMP